MKQEDIQNQEIIRLRSKANDPIGWKSWVILVAFVALGAYCWYLSSQNTSLKTEKAIKELKVQISEKKAALNTNETETRAISNHGKKAAKKAPVEAERVIKESNNYVPTANELEGAFELVNYGR